MDDRSASSSDDLDLARRISKRLRQGPSAPTPAPGYIRFSAAALVGAPPRPEFGPAPWNDMLDRAAADSAAEVAFVVDAQGLVVACRGSMDPALVEGIGARLLVAFEQAEQMAEPGARTGSIAIELGHRWLTGFQVRRGEASFTVGVLGPAVVPRAARGELARMLER
jgi:hypothetical protein